MTSPTLPEDLIPLHKQRNTTIHAMAKQIRSSQRIVPKSSIPSVICKTSFLKQVKYDICIMINSFSATPIFK